MEVCIIFISLCVDVTRHQEIVWLNSSLDCSEDDFAQALSDLLLQDARLEVWREMVKPKIGRWYLEGPHN